MMFKVFIFCTRDLSVCLMENLKKTAMMTLKIKKLSRNADNGWLGITDKYWVTAIVPPKFTNFKSTFLYKDNYKQTISLIHQ